MIKTSRIIIFQVAYSGSELQVAGTCPGNSGCKAGTMLDRMPFHRRAAHTHTHTHAHTHTHTYSDGAMQTCQFTPCKHLWDMGGNRIPGENPHKRGETEQTPQGQWPHRELMFFLISITTKWQMKWRYSRICCTCVYNG